MKKPWMTGLVVVAGVAVGAIVVTVLLRAGAITSIGPMIGAVIGILIMIPLLNGLTKRAKLAGAAAAGRGASLSFTFFPFPLVRTQIEQLRQYLVETTTAPKYGFARPVAAVEPESINLYLTDAPGSLFLSVPRSAVTRVGRERIRVGVSSFDVVTLHVSRDITLSLPPTAPDNVTAKPKAGYVDAVAEQLSAALTTAPGS